MTTALSIPVIKALPKIELHVHLDGSVKADTLIALAQKQNKTLPTYNVDELLSYMQVEEHCESLNEYLTKFDFILPFLQTADALEQVAYELVAQCAADNVRYVEVRYAPHLHTNEGLTIPEIYEAVIKGLQRGEQTFGVVARCIGTILRGHDEQKQLETVDVAAQFLHKGLVAVDLAGAEALYPPALYTAPFKRAHEHGLPITIHAGEAGGADHIWTSISELHASRIGHGVRLQEDEKVFNDVKQLHTPLEFCPISNIQTKAVDSWANYPIKHYMNEGICITVNTDNMTVSNTTLTKELATLVEKFNFTANDLMALQLNAVNSIFLESETKSKFQEAFKAELEAWNKQYNN